jgi:Zn-dependent protease
MTIGSLDLTVILIMLVSLVVSLVIHEFMHAYVGHLLGDTTAREEGRLTLNPLSHIDPVMTIALPIITLILFSAPVLAAKPVPFNPDRVKYDEFGAALIAAAGPLSNFALAFLAAVLDNFLVLGSFMHDAASIFIILNVAIGVFNLLPIPPLDGSRVLYAFAPEPLQAFMRQIEPYGLFIVFAVILTVGFSFLNDINNYILNLLP